MLFIVRALSKTRQRRLSGEEDKGRGGAGVRRGGGAPPVWRGTAERGPDTAHSHLSRPQHGAGRRREGGKQKTTPAILKSWVVHVFQSFLV